MAFSAGPQFDIPYEIVGPDGARVVFNDDSDPDYVGALSTISGFDSPEVRENYDDIVEFDGGLHGNFYYGRRAMTLEGLIYGFGTATLRNQRISKLKRATDAMRADATMTWTPSGGVEMFSSVRRQQPLRIDGAWNKTFLIPFVAADPRFYSTAVAQAEAAADHVGGDQGFSFSMIFNPTLDFGTYVAPGAVSVTNDGDTETFPTYTIFGNGTNPYIYNATTEKGLYFTGALSPSQALVVNTYDRTVYLADVDAAGDPITASFINRYSYVDFINTEWSGLTPGANDIVLGFETADIGAKLRVDWRSAWL